MSVRLRLLLLLVSFALLAAGGAGVATDLWAQSAGRAGVPRPSAGFPARLFLLGAGLAAAFCALGAVELIRFRPREEPRADYRA